MRSEKAKQYLDGKSPTRTHPVSKSVTYGLLSRYNAEKAIELAEQETEERMRAELTRWHDPKKELPEKCKDVILKSKCGNDIIYQVGALCDNSQFVGASVGYKVIGWREIHE